MTIPNLTEYQTLKTRKLISLQKIDAENIAVATKQFSVVDGVELPRQVLGVTISEVKKAIIDKKAEVITLEAFLADLMATV